VELLDSQNRIQDKIFKTRGPWLLRGCVNDTKTSGTLSGLHPIDNTKPDQTAIAHLDDLPIEVLQEHNYSFNAADEDGDDVFYIIDWNSLIPLWGQSFNIFPDIVESGQDYIKGHTYLAPGPKRIKASAKEHYGKYADWSRWGLRGEEGDPGIFWICWVNLGLYMGANPQSSSQPLRALVDEMTPFYGHIFGGDNVQEFLWTFIAPEGRAEAGNRSTKNCNYTFDEVDEYTVWFNVTDDLDIQTNISDTVVVQELLSDFNISSNYSIKPFETVYFNDTSRCISANTITSWNWTFGDGINAIGQNVTHVYNYSGEYNVTLTVADDDSNVDVYYQFVTAYVDFDPPEIQGSAHEVILDENRTTTVVITVDVFDEGKGVDLVGVNITSPVLEHFNLTMTHFLDDTYYIYFNSTDKSGIYTYTIWTMDNKDHVNVSSPYVFNVGSVFGNYVEGDQSVSVVDHMRGSNFTMNELGTADSITAYIRSQEDMMPLPKAKAMIYRVNDSVLIGTSEEINPNTGEGPAWKTFYFNSSKPVLENDTEYVLTLWADNACSLYYHNSTMALGRNDSETYDGSPPDPASFTNENRLYSIYCDFTPENTPPEIVNVSDAPNTVGFGGNVTISANVTDDKSGVYNVVVEVLYPDGSQHDLSLSNSVDDTYEYVFTDTGIAGTYEYTVWAYDYYQNENFSTDHSFNVSANATISVCTIKNTYGASEDINITDPPVNNPTNSDVGYELLDDGDVLHIWNKYDSYYFNTSSGIQLTNHYDEYWSHNVLMLGYYNNDQWNLIYRTDELSGFNKDIDTDNETYVNATLCKDLSYGGYDFRLAIQYHLELNDTELTITPYIKNLGSTIPYILGFGWEMKDMQIKGTPENDYIKVNRTSYYLNQTLDEKYTNLSFPILNSTGSTIGWSKPVFNIVENEATGSTKYLYLKWDKDLDYLLQVKDRTGQYNAPVTLFIKVGTLGVGQEKSTEMQWYDSESTYYFDDYDEGNEEWETNPYAMISEDEEEFAYTTQPEPDDIQLCTSNTYTSGGSGTITGVEIRAKGYVTGGEESGDIKLRPIFDGKDGDDHIFNLPANEGGWSEWFNITTDTNAPSPWTWSDVADLDCDVEADMDEEETVYCSKVELKVTYTSVNNSAPEISNPYPPDGSTGISISPTLNITVSDPDMDVMNITWYSNSSGSWTSFGTNNSVGNGTYYQTFSNATINGQWWYWKVNVTDGSNTTESSVYKFYTGYQSKITNAGSTSIKGYLLIQVQYYNETMELWEVDVGTDDLINGDGTYCVFAAFRDEYGEILECDDLSLLYAYWEFEVDTS